MNRASVGRLVARSLSILVLLVAPACACPGRDAPAPSPFRRGETGPRAILNVAHAGASSLAPQNTMIAGRTALAVGADVWGVDVRSTKDGVLILMHDETLGRTTDVEARFPSRAPWRVSDFTLDEIRTLDAGSWFLEEDPFGQIAEGAVSAEVAASYVGEPVPTLREALEFVAESAWLIDVEIKPPAEGERRAAAERLVRLIAETRTVDRVLVSSFDHEFLREVRKIDPTIPLGALAVFPPLGGLGELLALGADVYLPSVVAFTDALLVDLQAAGIHVIVWTYDTVARLEHAAGLPGVDGIYTDFPQRLAPLLEARGEASS